MAAVPPSEIERMRLSSFGPWENQRAAPMSEPTISAPKSLSDTVRSGKYNCVNSTPMAIAVPSTKAIKQPKARPVLLALDDKAPERRNPIGT